jgi:hypothetical protein
MRESPQRTAAATRHGPRSRPSGRRFNSLKLLEPVKQKSIRHTPAQKLQDAFIAILAGRTGFRRSTRAPGMKHYNVRSGVEPVPTRLSLRKR